MTEQEYDTIIAPKLMEIMKEVSELGGSFLCYASFDTDDGKGFGETTHLPNPTAHEQIMHMALRTKGNFDSLCMALKRAEKNGKIDCSQSLFLNRGFEPA